MSRTASQMEWTLELFEIRPSLWKLVEEYVAPSERPEIKEALGEDLVDETLDLHEEASALLDIWRDYREETEKEIKEEALKRHLCRLPEPPLMRENLKKEIRMFVESLQQRAIEQGRKTSSVLSRRDSEIIGYVLEDAEARRGPEVASWPSTALASRDGRQTPMRATPSSDGSRCTSSLSDHLESMNDKLNSLEIDRVTDNLRQLLREEKEGLLEDITFLQDCLFEESDYRQQATAPVEQEPSLKDLRDLGTKLEKEILNCVGDQDKHSKQPRRSLTSPYKKHSIEEPPCIQSPLRRLSSGSKNPTVPRPPSTPHDRHHVGKTRIIAASQSEVSGLRQKHFSPSPPGSASSLVPSPPNSAKTNRPTSAARFRKRVIECRESCD